MRVGVGGVEVVDVARRDERQAALRGEPGQRVEHRLLDLEPGVLELDVGVVAAEDLLQPVELHLGVAHPRLRDRLRDPPRQAAGERDQARRVLREELPVDARPVVVALQVAERAELDQVGVAGRRLGQQREVRRPLRLHVPVVGDVHLAPDDRLHALLVGGLVEVDRAGQRAVVGERHRRHLEPGRLVDERRDPARPVEDRVLGVDVQVDERGAHGRPSYWPRWTAPVRAGWHELGYAEAAEPCRRRSRRSRASSDTWYNRRSPTTKELQMSTPTCPGRPRPGRHRPSRSGDS